MYDPGDEAFGHGDDEDNDSASFVNRLLGARILGSG